MVDSTYIQGRKVAGRGRPQGILLSNNPGTLTQDGFYVPLGYEIGATVPEGTPSSEVDQFLILSDDNRAPLDFKIERIEKRERTINGRMRSYHIADKLSLSVSWERLPSRAGNTRPGFDENGKPISTFVRNLEDIAFYSYTTDAGAGGAEILDWYENHSGSFWAFLSYDKYTNFGKNDSAYQNLNKYSQVVEVFFSDFSYAVQKRGGSNHDYWNISFTLEEV